MNKIDLREYVTSDHKLTADQLDALLRVSKTLRLSIEPIRGTKGNYSLTPGSIIGALEINGIPILINPKIEMSKLLSLACYAIGKLEIREELFGFKDSETLPDILALALTQAARSAFARGLLRGYRSEEEALHTVRGRIRFDEQVRRRYGIPLPVELRFDEFTEDILANRLVKAAAVRLRRMTLRSSKARRGLGWVAATLDNVSLLEFRQGRVPEVCFDRLNEHYRHVVGLARLVLLHSEFEAELGDVRANGFLVDMNDLFQEFVTQALRETLGVSERTLRADKSVDEMALDKDGEIQVFPDLTLWNGRNCIFVGDAKYKDLTNKRARNADLYQLLAYATALDLPGGLLIYAQGAPGETTYQVENAGKLLMVAALDLSQSIEDILSRVSDIANMVKDLRELALPAKTTTTASSPMPRQVTVP